ncbi:Galectin-3-binding protein A [Holothuria leucospilota]|uniref:Galectin-3-binding protein A n=1 Tax=Holothuria leucospilota TaxID=206669 RepID=A0A9Q1H3S7_HOLLE|nr:Galectin-3-binding protein A [Holothuria leucospilota]
MENLMCTEGLPRARSVSSYAWCPGARERAPSGSRGRSPRKLSQYCILRAQKSAPVLMSEPKRAPVQQTTTRRQLVKYFEEACQCPSDTNPLQFRHDMSTKRPSLYRLAYKSFRTENVIEDVRLIGGPSNSSGLIEVLFNNEWRTVCEDGWTLTESTIVCRQLGYPSAVVTYHSGFFGEGSRFIRFNELQCNGNESILSECQHTNFLKTACKHDISREQ